MASEDAEIFPRIRHGYGGVTDHERQSSHFPGSTALYRPKRPNSSGHSHVRDEYSRTEIQELWHSDDRPCSASGGLHTFRKSGNQNRKKRPTSSGSSTSSASSVALRKTGNDHHGLVESETFRETYFRTGPFDGAEDKKESLHKHSFRSAPVSNGEMTWMPQPPSQPPMMFTKSVSSADANDGNLVHSYIEKIHRLTQERDSFSLQASHYRQVAETAQSDLAAEKVKNGSLGEEICGANKRVGDMEQEVIDLKCEIESGKQNLARQNAMVNSLQQRVKDAEDFAMDRENLMSRNDITISSLKKELQSQQDKARQIETSLKYHIGVEEENTRKAETWENKFREMCAQLAVALSLDSDESTSSARDLIITKVSELCKENEMLTAKVNSLMHNVQTTGLDAKANRETIMRLVADIGKEQKIAAERLQQVENLTRERDVATQKVRELELELSVMKDKLNQGQQAWLSARAELEDKDLRLSKMEKKMSSYEYSNQKKENKLNQFRRQLAEILSDVGMAMEESEEEILKGVKAIQAHFKSLRNNDEKLQSRVSTLAEEMSNQRNLQKSTLARAREAESRIHDLTNRVTSLEGELLAADVERDQLKEEKKKYVAFLDTMARAMRIDQIGHDVEFGLSADALVVRAEQLAKSETESLQDRTTAIYNLQRKVKTLKQQAESKEFQISLMKKKVSELEEQLKDKNRSEKERDDSSTQNKKLQRKCEKLLDEVSHYQEIVTQLKAKLMETSEFKIKNMEQEKKIEELEGTVNKLARSKQKSSIELAGIKKELRSSAQLAKTDESERIATIQQLESQLKITHEALEEVKKRENQLNEFRQVIASVLGLEIRNLSVPDYDIISRLEKIVKAYQAHSVAAHSLENTLHGMNSDFRTGYEDAITILNSPEVPRKSLLTES